MGYLSKSKWNSGKCKITTRVNKKKNQIMGLQQRDPTLMSFYWIGFPPVDNMQVVCIIYEKGIIQLREVIFLFGWLESLPMHFFFVIITMFIA